MTDTWPNGVPLISEQERAEALGDPARLRDLIVTLWLYIGRYAETQLTTEQKELLADAVEQQPHRDEEMHYDRWWRR
jgi:hypothetical protein